MDFQIVYEKSQSLVTKNLVITVEPIYSFEKLLPFFLERFKLHTSAKVDHADFKKVLYLLLYVRLMANRNQHLCQITHNFLSTIRIPKGLQKIVHFTPLGGLSYNYKNHVLEFQLSQSVVDDIEAGIRDNSYFMGAQNLSRHLAGNKNALSEKFDENLIYSMSQTFQMSSYIVENKYPNISDQSELTLRCGNRSPDFNIGIALSFVLGFKSEECLQLDRLLGITWTCTMSVVSFDSNVRKAFSALLTGIDNGPGSSKTKGTASGGSNSGASSNSNSTSNNANSNKLNLMLNDLDSNNKALLQLITSIVYEAVRVANTKDNLTQNLARA